MAGETRFLSQGPDRARYDVTKGEGQPGSAVSTCAALHRNGVGRQGQAAHGRVTDFVELSGFGVGFLSVSTVRQDVLPSLLPYRAHGIAGAIFATGGAEGADR